MTSFDGTLSRNASSTTLNENLDSDGNVNSPPESCSHPSLTSAYVFRGRHELVTGRELDLGSGYQVRFAPIHVPLERRLETATVLWHSFAVAVFLSLFWFLFAVPLFWPILIPYFIFVFRSQTPYDGSVPYKRSTFLRQLPLWKYFKSYFPLTLHRTTVLDPTKNYIFGYHPHGIISHGAFGSFVLEDDRKGGQFARLFPGITNTLLTIDSNFKIPFYRDYLIALGLASVSRRSCESLLRGSYLQRQHPSLLQRLLTFPFRVLRLLQPVPAPHPPQGGRAITIVLGGASESLHASPGTLKLVLRKRKGFVKLALREGAYLVPVLAFGENDLYDTILPPEKSWMSWFQGWIKSWAGFTMPIFHARGVFNYDVGILPYRLPVDVVVGRPVGLEGRREATSEEVEELQEMYINELERLWETYKDVFAKRRKRGLQGELHILE